MMPVFQQGAQWVKVAAVAMHDSCANERDVY